MKSLKPNIYIRFRLELLAIIASACLLLGVGVAWARYATTMDPVNAAYTAKDAAVIQLWSGVDANGNLLAGESAWQKEASGTYSLEFCISNGTNNLFSRWNQNTYIRLFATLSAGITGSTAVELYLSPEGPVNGIVNSDAYLAEIREIQAGSPVYDTVGKGWVFSFRNSEGAELSWELLGGQQSVLYAKIVIRNIELTDSANITLQVSGDVI